MLVTKKRLFVFALALLLCIGVSYGVSAQTLNTGLQFGTGTGLANQDFRVTIVRIIRIILGFLGVFGVCMLIYAGWVWMTARGDEEKVTKAKTILKNGIIGLAIILSSFAIVSFILGRLLGATGIGGNQNGNGNGNNGGGVSGLGNGIVKSVYPEPFQTDVWSNTSIIVTFREKMQAASLCFPVTAEGKCAPGAQLMPDSVKIYKTTEGSGERNVREAVVYSNDNTTFIFKPAPPYLGVGTVPVNYTVNLTNEVKKADGGDAFGLNDFRWTFEVNGKLDLISPQIVSVGSGGINPETDNEKDIVGNSQAAVAASGTITVNGQPSTQKAASATIKEATPSAQAGVEGINTCVEGTINMSIIESEDVGGLKARVNFSQPGLQPADLSVSNNRVIIVPCGITVVFKGAISAGHSWRISVVPARSADTVTAGSKIYSFVSGNPAVSQIAVGNTIAATAANIAAAINSATSIHPEMTATVNAATVTLKAKISGEAGNSLELSTSNAVALSVSRMNGGRDQATTYTIRGKEDQPKNAVIQINFNEAINPLTVGGTSTELAEILRIVNSDDKADADGASCTADADCRSYKCSGTEQNAGTCQGDQLAGKFLISNQYKTVEFISDIKCGVNGCGENIYCLPANSEIRVEASAAALFSCTSNANCTQAPYNTCVSGVCRDTVQNKNYSLAANQLGIIDVADNSLDGNRNSNPQGKTGVWNENTDTPAQSGTRGDNYRWSFWVSDQLDLTPPRIISTGNVPNNQNGVGLSAPLEALFSKLMMSASLSTGSIVVDNGIKQVTHKLINLWSLANDPIGYWVQKNDRDSNNDGRPDRTAALLNHGIFNSSTGYEAQVGSGVKDLYQNCYKPSAGPNCNANSLQPSCCRNSEGTLVPTTELSPDGNCK